MIPVPWILCVSNSLTTSIPCHQVFIRERKPKIEATQVLLKIEIARRIRTRMGDFRNVAIGNFEVRCCLFQFLDRRKNTDPR